MNVQTINTMNSHEGAAAFQQHDVRIKYLKGISCLMEATSWLNCYSYPITLVQAAPAGGMH